MGNQDTQRQAAIEARYAEMMREEPAYARLCARAAQGDEWAAQLAERYPVYPGDEDCC